MPHDIFISYSTKDKPVADAVCAGLEAAGLRCWIAPRDIRAGEDWPSAIVAAIAASRLMVLIFSASSNESPEVPKEVNLALRSKVNVVPFRIDNVLPQGALDYYLAGTHWLDALDGPTEQNMGQLVATVRSLAPAPNAASSAEETLPSEHRLTNLPPQLTSFVGREHEIAEIVRLLGETRLLTLIGSGGAGKTRLAIQVAELFTGAQADGRLAMAFPDGVWLVELAPVADPTLVASTLAAVLGMPVTTDKASEQLVKYLRQRKVMILLDNCEHLIRACAELAEALLRGCADVQLLATSCEGLNIPGEVAWRVPSLAVEEATRLFLERARSSNPHLTLTENKRQLVAEICVRLDGMPLALELAAARLRMLSLDQIASRLNDRFALLTGGMRTALPHHQTLRATIDWSYELLALEEQVLLGRLSVFAGGWTLEMAEAVCGEVLEALAQLVDKSLVIAEETQEGVRYRLLETIRQYGREKLEAAGEYEKVHQRHMEVFASMAQEAELHLRGQEQVMWLNRLEGDLDNLRAALAWCQAQGDAQAGLRMAGVLWRFWFLRGYFVEGRRWLESTASAADGALALRAKVLAGAAFIAVYSGDIWDGRSLCEESLALAREAGDKPLAALSLIIMGDSEAFITYMEVRTVNMHEEGLALARSAGDKWLIAFALAEYGEAVRIQQRDEQSLKRAVAHLQESLALARMCGDRWLIALALLRMGSALTDSNDFVSARSCHEESLALRRAMRDRLGAAFALLGLAIMAEKQGDFASAHAYLLERLAEERELDNQLGVGNSFNGLGLLALRWGEYALAKRYLQESVTLFRRLYPLGSLNFQLMCLAVVAIMQSDYQQARALLVESLSLYRYSPSSNISIIEAFGRIAAALGKPALAARLFGAVEAIGEISPDMIGASVIRANDSAGYTRVLTAVRAELNEDAFSAAWSEGRAMTQQQAIDYALQNIDAIADMTRSG